MKKAGNMVISLLSQANVLSVDSTCCILVLIPIAAQRPTACPTFSVED